MHISKINFDKITALSHKDVFYQNNTEKLSEFINFLPNIEGLEKSIQARKNYKVNRELLFNVVSDHYKEFKKSNAQAKNINSLKDENTFTIITAHQPSLLGGPAYYFYKICSTINLCRQLNLKFPNQNFVPVFVNGSEDHDFDEIKQVHLFNKTVEWDTNQTGPVGRFILTNLDKAISEFTDILGKSEKIDRLKFTWETALSSAKNYNQFVFQWVNEIFNAYGVLVINMDDKKLKTSFIPVMRKEILERKSEEFITETQEKLQNFQFKPQAYARTINLFYFNNKSRERIIFEDGVYKINNTDITFTESEILSELENFPDRFSPNVVIRPLYQEYVLPNIAYIGGGGEIAYWLERKKQFEYFGIFFPCLIRRNSVMLLNKSIQKSMEKLDVKEDDLLEDENQIITNYLNQSTEVELSLGDEIESIREVYHNIAAKAKLIDPTLEHVVLAELSKIEKSTESIESRLKRSVKQKEETAVNQIKSLKSKLFPNHGLQERSESLIPYLMTEDGDLLDELVQNLNPLEKEFLFVYF